MDPHECAEENAAKFASWIANRGGLLIWRSVNLCNPGQSWTSPALTEDGKPYPKPTWEAADTPERHITSVDDVVVYTSKVVKSFHVGVKRGCGMGLVLTDAATRRVRSEVDKASKKHGKPAWYAFDYGAYENAVILVEDASIPLAKWLETRKSSAEQTR